MLKPLLMSLVLLVAALESIFAAIGLAILGLDAEGLHWAIRWTGRLSLLLFLSAFLANSLQRSLHRPWTAVLLRRRRYVGLAFAASQLIHLVLIGLAYRRAPATMGPLDFAFYGGAVGYFFTGLLALTSNDQAFHWLGPKRWRLLHSTGMYALWLIFFVTYLPGFGLGGIPLVFLLVLGLALIFKLTVKFAPR
ncbi:MAG TPA: hypothetical protein VFW62_07420, partial [bacterium]|nr:hypothetical protein [bacterium]